MNRSKIIIPDHLSHDHLTVVKPVTQRFLGVGVVVDLIHRFRTRGSQRSEYMMVVG